MEQTISQADSKIRQTGRGYIIIALTFLKA